jgi:hypothetical protein
VKRDEEFSYPPPVVVPAPPDRPPGGKVTPLVWFVFGSISTLAVLAVAGVLP